VEGWTASDVDCIGLVGFQKGDVGQRVTKGNLLGRILANRKNTCRMQDNKLLPPALVTCSISSC